MSYTCEDCLEMHLGCVPAYESVCMVKTAVSHVLNPCYLSFPLQNLNLTNTASSPTLPRMDLQPLSQVALVQKPKVLKSSDML